MHLTFRWYGPSDPVALADIRQIPAVEGVVTALYDVAPGTAWTADAVRALRDEVEAAGLTVTTVESIPVPERVKLGADGRDADLDAFCRSLEAVGEALGDGVRQPVVCYNFMPVFDWTRTDLGQRLPDGSLALAYRRADLGRIETALAEGGLPGWMDAHPPAELRRLLAAYASVDDEALWDHLGYFLERVSPVAEAAGVRLAIHPDDPPWPVFGLPRVVTSGAAYERVVGLVDSPANGVTLCTGSLGANPAEAARLPETVRALGDRVHFAHLRNVRHGDAHPDGTCDFEEASHPEGDVDLGAVVRALAEVGFSGPARPDHGRMIWGEVGPDGTTRRGVRPGYGLYDRALGATYLRGLWEGATHSLPPSAIS